MRGTGTPEPRLEAPASSFCKHAPVNLALPVILPAELQRQTYIAIGHCRAVTVLMGVIDVGTKSPGGQALFIPFVLGLRHPTFPSLRLYKSPKAALVVKQRRPKGFSDFAGRLP